MSHHTRAHVSNSLIPSSVEDFVSRAHFWAQLRPADAVGQGLAICVFRGPAEDSDASSGLRTTALEWPSNAVVAGRAHGLIWELGDTTKVMSSSA